MCIFNLRVIRNMRNHQIITGHHLEERDFGGYHGGTRSCKDVVLMCNDP